MNSEYEINFELYKIFYVTAIKGNLTSAARALFLTQPSVSKHIQNLENALDVSLFTRNKKGVSLTKEGAALFKHIEPACKHILAAEQELISIKNIEKGEISIISSEMGFLTYVFPAMDEFRKKHPDIRFFFENRLNDEMVEMLSEGKSDMAIVHSPFNIPKHFRSDVINEVREILVCSPEMAKSLPDRKYTPEDLINLPITTMRRESSTYAYFEEYFAEAGLDFNPSIVLSSMALTIQAVESGVAIGILPDRYALPLISQGKLVEIKLEKPLSIRQACLITNPMFPLSIASKEFIKFLTTINLKDEMVFDF